MNQLLETAEDMLRVGVMSQENYDKIIKRYRKENIPNKETIRVFKDTDEGKNLVRCDDLDDLIDKLDLK